MKDIKIYFVDFWKGFDQNNNFFVDCLSQHYNVVLDPSPDYLFYSLFGYQHLNYNNCIKIYFTGENDVPDFNFCDYALGFQHLSFEDRYIRYPLYLLYGGYDELNNKQIEDCLSKRKFCNFVYSNSKYATPLREKFFHQLSKYKKVDSGGRLLNNVGGPIADKMRFIKDYKFTIAFENSSLSGYTTEKLMEPMVVNSLPIYWGNPNVHLDFNPSSILNINDFATFDDAIAEIMRLDKDDEAYLHKLSQPWLTNEQVKNDWTQKLTDFFFNIFNQPLSQASRCTQFGYAVIKKHREAKFSKLSTLPILRNL